MLAGACRIAHPPRNEELLPRGYVARELALGVELAGVGPPYLLGRVDDRGADVERYSFWEEVVASGHALFGSHSRQTQWVSHDGSVF